MIIKSISLQDFRNYESLELTFDKKNNIIFGDNAQGKTNLLEACFVSGTSRSFRNCHDSEMIRFGMDEAHIKTIVEKNGRDVRIDIHLKKNKKKGIAVNRVPLKRASDLFGILSIILFSPDDLEIIKQGPQERRRFLDMELCQIDKIYLSDLSQYKKALMNRNQLLKDIYNEPSLRDTLPVWNEKVAEYGKKVIRRREAFVLDLAPIVKDIHKNLSGGREEPVVTYSPDVTAEAISDVLEKNTERDLRAGTTTAGPHRDDIIFEIDGKDIRTFGSEGQKRTCALSLKLSEIKMIENSIHQEPVLLLDDVLSELDRNRQKMLLSSLNDVQTIVTCTGIDDFIKERMSIDRIFEVKAGKVNCEEI